MQDAFPLHGSDLLRDWKMRVHVLILSSPFQGRDGYAFCRRPATAIIVGSPKCWIKHTHNTNSIRVLAPESKDSNLDWSRGAAYTDKGAITRADRAAAPTSIECQAARFMTSPATKGWCSCFCAWHRRAKGSRRPSRGPGTVRNGRANRLPGTKSVPFEEMVGVSFMWLFSRQRIGANYLGEVLQRDMGDRPHIAHSKATIPHTIPTITYNTLVEKVHLQTEPIEPSLRQPSRFWRSLIPGRCYESTAKSQ